MDDKQKPNKKKTRKPLPKLKQLKNTQSANENLAGAGGDAEATHAGNVTCYGACITACPWCQGQGPGSPGGGAH